MKKERQVLNSRPRIKAFLATQYAVRTTGEIATAIGLCDSVVSEVCSKMAYQGIIGGRARRDGVKNREWWALDRSHLVVALPELVAPENELLR